MPTTRCGGGSRTPRSSPQDQAQTDRADTLFVHDLDPGPLRNRLLAALSHNDFQFLQPHLGLVQFAQGDVLYEVGAEVDQVFFPVSGMVSFVMMRDGKAIETATVGREGVVGAMSGFGLHTMKVRAIAHASLVLRLRAIRRTLGVLSEKPPSLERGRL